MNDPFLAALGICKRAGKLSFGFETVKCAMQIGQAQVVFSAVDLSPKTAKELRFLCSQLECELIETAYDMQTLGCAIGRKTGIISVNDEGLAKMVTNKFVNHREGI
jgi:ribosomal protein L7Ae-like RNA K-turn-binding protein